MPASRAHLFVLLLSALPVGALPLSTGGAAAGAALAASPSAGDLPDTLSFVPVPTEDSEFLTDFEPEDEEEPPRWLRTPIGDALLVDREQWRPRPGRAGQMSLHGDYNRVDRIRLGLGYQIQVADPMAPRLGGRIEYATGRNRVLYGFQFEQPLVRPGRIALGASLVRRTDHSELQQVSNAENSLALLLAREDYRDYWERQGQGLYLAWRVPDFSTVSLHLRRDQVRSLTADFGVRSWFRRSRALRPNPPVDDGETRSVALRLERGMRATRHTHAGLYHWVEIDRAGAGLGGDFTYTRLLGDVRSILRLSPATTLLLRAVVGHTAAGRLPAQKEFPLGGVDGLRAHALGQFRGDQLALAQAEYLIGLWRLSGGAFEGGLHAIVFVDAGRAWYDPRHRWALGRQALAVDGGFGLATAEDKLRVYFARNLQDTDSPFVITLRLHHPF